MLESVAEHDASISSFQSQISHLQLRTLIFDLSIKLLMMADECEMSYSGM